MQFVLLLLSVLVVGSQAQAFQFSPNSSTQLSALPPAERVEPALPGAYDYGEEEHEGEPMDENYISFGYPPELWQDEQPLMFMVLAAFCIDLQCVEQYYALELKLLELKRKLDIKVVLWRAQHNEPLVLLLRAKRFSNEPLGF